MTVTGAPGRAGGGAAVPVRVRPGLWALTLPLPAAPGTVTVYVVESDAGPYLIDAGWDTEECWSALVGGLALLGTRVEDVRGIAVSHSHMDHYGLAPRIREASGAWVGLHPLDATELRRYRTDPAERLAALLARAGAPQDAMDAVLAEAGLNSGHRVGGPDVLIEDGQRPEISGRELTAVWTPGHSPGHLCFWDDRHRLLFAGDQVLARTVVAVQEPRKAGEDPLGLYLESLDRLELLEPAEVLPAHEERYTDLPGRLAQIRAYHEGRLSDTVAILARGPATAWEIAGLLRKRGTLDGLRGFPLHATVSRATTLLARLRAQGLARELPGPPARWSLTERGAQRIGHTAVGRK